MKKKIGILCLTAFLILGGQVKASGDKQLVFDYADILTVQEENTLSDRAEEFTEEYHLNFVILTTDDAEGKTSEEYADDFYMDQGFYYNEKSGGAIFLIDMDNRRVQVETAGDMLDKYITDKRVDGIVDAGYEYLKAEKYQDCFLAMLDTCAGYIEDGVVSGKYVYNEDTGEYRVYRSITVMEFLVALLISLAAGGIACGCVIGKYRLKWGTYKYPFKNHFSLNLTVRQDRFLGQYITHRHIEKNHGGGGGDSGATTSHTSSGGGEFGGGGRDF